MSYNSKYTGEQVENLLDQVAQGGGAGEQGPQGPQGEQGPKGEDGEDGVGVQSVAQTTTSNADGGSNVVTVTLTDGTKSTFTVKNGSKGSQGIQGEQGPKGDTGANGKDGADGTNGKDGADGEDGATFTPSVDAAGNLSWSNDKGLANPPTVNIKGPKGDAGEDIKDEVYIADFTMESLRDGIYNGTNVECDVQALVSAMNANKVILVREGEDSLYKGVYVLNGFAEDLLYFSIVDTSGNILWCEGTDYMSSQYIDGQSLHIQNWDDKQDTLVSGENIKTINGESILGEGNIIIAGGDTGSGGGNAPEVVEVEATTKLGSTRVTFADILPNKIYICNEPIDQQVTITFAPSTSPIDNYIVIFRSSAAGTSLNVPDNVIFNSTVLIGRGVHEFSFRRINWGDEEVIYGLRANFE